MKHLQSIGIALVLLMQFGCGTGKPASEKAENKQTDLLVADTAIGNNKENMSLDQVEKNVLLGSQIPYDSLRYAKMSKEEFLKEMAKDTGIYFISRENMKKLRPLVPLLDPNYTKGNSMTFEVKDLYSDMEFLASGADPVEYTKLFIQHSEPTTREEIKKNEKEQIRQMLTNTLSDEEDSNADLFYYQKAERKDLPEVYQKIMTGGVDIYFAKSLISGYSGRHSAVLYLYSDYEQYKGSINSIDSDFKIPKLTAIDKITSILFRLNNCELNFEIGKLIPTDTFVPVWNVHCNFKMDAKLSGKSQQYYFRIEGDNVLFFAIPDSPDAKGEARFRATSIE